MRVDVGDERRVWDAAQLGGEGRSQREDVRDDDVRSQLAHERQRVARGVHDSLVEVQRLGAVGERLVLGGGREAQIALGFDRRAASAPRSAR